MAQTMTTTSTAIELGAYPDEGTSRNNLTQRDRPANLRAGASDLSSEDPVLEASRLADSVLPDGGYGWVVIFGCAVVCWWFVGISYSWGVIQGSLADKGLAPPATLAFLGSLPPTLISVMAILNARIIRWVGLRRTAMLGVTLLGLSSLTSSFAVDSVPGLFVTNGCILGLGMSLCFMTASVSPAQYFSRKRGLATGIVYAGGGLGGAVISYALDALIQRFGLPWAYRIIGITTLVTGLPAAWLVKERGPIRPGGLVDWQLFRDRKFFLVFLGGAVGTFPLFVAPFFIPLYSRAIGLSTSTGAGLLAGYNFASAVGRISLGFLCDKIGPVNSLITSLVLTAVSMLALWPASTTVGPLAFFVVVNGASNGGFFAAMPTVVGNVFGSQRVSVAMGMVATGWAGGYLMGAPIAGYLLDAYGGAENGLQAYRPAMFWAGSMAVGSTLLVAAMRFSIKKSLLAKV